MLGALCASTAAICATMRRAAPFASDACLISCTASLLACLLRAGPLVGEALSCLAAQMTMACMQRGGLHEQLQLLFDMLCMHCRQKVISFTLRVAYLPHHRSYGMGYQNFSKSNAA